MRRDRRPDPSVGADAPDLRRDRMRRRVARPSRRVDPHRPSPLEPWRPMALRRAGAARMRRQDDPVHRHRQPSRWSAPPTRTDQPDGQDRHEGRSGELHRHVTAAVDVGRRTSRDLADGRARRQAQEGHARAAAWCRPCRGRSESGAVDGQRGDRRARRIAAEPSRTGRRPTPAGRVRRARRSGRSDTDGPTGGCSRAGSTTVDRRRVRAAPRRSATRTATATRPAAATGAMRSVRRRPTAPPMRGGRRPALEGSAIIDVDRAVPARGARVTTKGRTPARA